MIFRNKEDFFRHHLVNNLKVGDVISRRDSRIVRRIGGHEYMTDYLVYGIICENPDRSTGYATIKAPEYNDSPLVPPGEKLCINLLETGKEYGKVLSYRNIDCDRFFDSIFDKEYTSDKDSIFDVNVTYKFSHGKCSLKINTPYISYRGIYKGE